VKVHLLLPCRGGSTQLDTTVWIAQLVASGLVSAFSHERGCAHVEVARAELLDVARRGTADAVLFIDDDIASIEGAALLQAMIDVDQPIVAMTYLRRGSTNDVLLERAANQRPSFRGGQSCLRIESTGLGCTLIQRHAFEKMFTEYDGPLGQASQKHPWDICNLFLPSIIDRTYHGDDASFFRRARMIGMPVHTLLDRNVSHDGRPHQLSTAF
jgi:hypothetical protein